MSNCPILQLSILVLVWEPQTRSHLYKWTLAHIFFRGWNKSFAHPWWHPVKENPANYESEGEQAKRVSSPEIRTSQELRTLSNVTLYWRVTLIVGIVVLNCLKWFLQGNTIVTPSLRLCAICDDRECFLFKFWLDNKLWFQSVTKFWLDY